MAFDDIEKLKEKIAKDPSSKLFVPLSEEYRKAGMFDDAVEVLKKGLEAQPSYMSARVALGKIYLEKEMTAEARDEFEQVIKAIPDNLFAHKKLAEIYRDLGEPGRAIGAYETVLKLNPLDEDAKINLESLADAGEKVHEAAPAEVAPVIDEPLAETEKGTTVSEAAVAPEADVPISIDEEVPEIEIGDSGGGESVNDGLASEAFEDFRRSIEADSRAAEATDDTPMFFAGEEKEEVRGMELSDDREDTIAIEPEPREEPVHAPDPLPQTGPVRESPPDGVVSELKQAEELIGQNQFGRAMQVYTALLHKYPDDRKILQKIEELRNYLKMIGKDGEETVRKMERFLDGIRKRKDDLYGRA